MFSLVSFEKNLVSFFEMAFRLLSILELGASNPLGQVLNGLTLISLVLANAFDSVLW